MKRGFDSAGQMIGWRAFLVSALILSPIWLGGGVWAVCETLTTCGRLKHARVMCPGYEPIDVASRGGQWRNSEGGAVVFPKNCMWVHKP